MRHRFRHQDHVVYEWDQTLNDLNIYIQVPAGVKGKQIYVDLEIKHIRVGIKPNPPYLEVNISWLCCICTLASFLLHCSFILDLRARSGPQKDLGGTIKTSESYWTLDNGELQIQLTKAQKGETWESALDGHSLQGTAKDADQKRLLLERFQHEHPGFDFSSAEISGDAPNPRTFLGGYSEN